MKRKCLQKNIVYQAIGQIVDQDEEKIGATENMWERIFWP